jgi:hypothetical protein
VTGLTDLLQSVFMLTSSVSSLKSDVQRMNSMLLEMNERLVRLENSGDLIAEKSKNAALTALNLLSQELMREVYSLRARMDALGSPQLSTAAGLRLERPDENPPPSS